MTLRLSAKSALVTGGASGIGAAIARRFVAEGAFVHVADRDPHAAAAMAASLGDTARPLQLDVAEPDAWQRAAETLGALPGGLHIIVNNAGICIPGDVEQISPEDWHRTFAVDLDSVFLSARALLPLMRETVARGAGGGSILNIASISAVVAASNMSAYNAAKAGVLHLTRSIALHCARTAPGITCNALLPTFIDTPLLDAFTGARSREETIAKLSRQIPLGRIGQPDDVAQAATFLCSDEASFITGADLKLDGGLSAQ